MVSSFLFLLPISLFVALSNNVSATANENDDDHEQLLILVVFDGFRHDYLSKTDTPNFDRLMTMGVKPAGVIPAFATKTFPGHHTIATGLFQESHGIIGNDMYDPEFNSTFNQGNAETRWWDYGGEPIWVTNQRNGGRTVSVFWPGDRVNISGMTATYHQPAYDESFTFEARIDLVVGLMSNGSANLGILYFHQPDKAGHLTGPDSAETADAISLCDETLGYLLDKLTIVGLIDDVNIIVTSDHGMTPVSSNQTVFIDDYVDGNLYFYTNNDPVFGMWPYDDNDTMGLYNALKDAHPNMDVYLKADIPDEYHYRDNRRTSPILAIGQDGWHVWANRSIDGNWQRYRGNHGYLNTVENMRSVFIAAGPAFKSNYSSDDWLQAVDVYGLMCHVLSVDPAPNNGTFSHVEPMLKTDNSGSRKSYSPFVMSLVLIVFLAHH